VQDRDVIEAMRGLVVRLLESGLVDSVLVPRPVPGNDGYAQSLVKNPEMLADANPLAPTMPVQSAHILSDLTMSGPAGRIAAVLKPCELRAAVELVKFLQVSLDNVVTICVDCPGTYEVKDFSEMPEEQRPAAVQALAAGKPENVRRSCRICSNPAPVNADITFGLFSRQGDGDIPVIVGDRFADDVAGKLELDLKDGDVEGREDAVKTVVDGRMRERDKELGELKSRTDSIERLLEVMSTCIRCHNCMTVCPICYCKECVFQSAVFAHRPDQFLKWAGRKGAIRMPADTLMFHLTRMSHMATSCVGCGMCDSACPSGLPVASLFELVGSDLQAMFEYVPGRAATEEPPVSVFKEDELPGVEGDNKA